MEVSDHNYLLLLAFIKLVSFASIVYIILNISKNHCFSKSMNYFKTYFILAFILTFIHIILEILNLEQSFNAVVFVYFATSMVLLLAINEQYRNRLITIIFSTILLSYLLLSIYFQFTLLQNLMIHALGSIVLYSIILIASLNKAKQLDNIGFYILASAFLILIMFSFLELFYIYINNLEYAYTCAVSGANSGFILVIIGFLTQIMMSEYKVLNSIALTDPLTGMNNRRGLYHLLESIIPSSNRNSECYSVITMDIDFFKKVNDSYGHDAGDIVLREFAKMIKATHRNTDVAARLGGEEFILILPETDKKAALVIAENLRLKTEILKIEVNEISIKITSSFGVDTSCSEFDMDELFKNADKALYQSKSTGRNKVIHFLDL